MRALGGFRRRKLRFFPRILGRLPPPLLDGAYRRSIEIYTRRHHSLQQLVRAVRREQLQIDAARLRRLRRVQHFRRRLVARVLHYAPEIEVSLDEYAVALQVFGLGGGDVVGDALREESVAHLADGDRDDGA